MDVRIGIRMANSAGLVVSTGTAAVPAADLLHTLGTNRSNIRRSAYIRKILVYNNTGGNVPLQFGTLTNAAVFAQLLPDLVAINGLENEWNEHELPCVEFSPDRTAGAGGVTGDIYVESLGAAAGVLVILEVEEFGT